MAKNPGDVVHCSIKADRFCGIDYESVLLSPCDPNAVRMLISLCVEASEQSRGMVWWHVLDGEADTIANAARAQPARRMNVNQRNWLRQRYTLLGQSVADADDCDCQLFMQHAGHWMACSNVAELSEKELVSAFASLVCDTPLQLLTMAPCIGYAYDASVMVVQWRASRDHVITAIRDVACRLHVHAELEML